jgi:3-phosphoshikimate 1-carboxyvinyltransferase
MTKRLIETFPWQGGRFQIEPDASSGSYFRGIGWLQSIESPDLKRAMNTLVNTSKQMARADLDTETAEWIRANWESWNGIVVNRWPNSGWQVDDRFFGLPRTRNHISRKDDLGDSVMTAIVLAPFTSDSFKFTDLGRLRLQECERVVALRTELTKCGAKVIEEGDTLTVYPSKLHGAVIETYNDHRMAMCFAILGLKVPGIKLKNPAS